MAQMFMERPVEGAAPASTIISDADAITLFKQCKKESFDNRWVWERVWMRNIHYVNNRQWIEYVRKSNEWRDVKLASWFPKPVTNKMAEGVQSLRAMFSSVNIGVNVRPNGSDPKNVAVAAVADDYGPLLHEEHRMDEVMNEADFWFIVTGNVFLHTYLERDAKHGTTKIPFEQCVGCGALYTTDVFVEGGACPDCGDTQPPVPAMSPETGAPIEKEIPNGKGVTLALSPFELAFPNTYPRFDDVPYVMWPRWRTKEYYLNHPTLKGQVAEFKWAKAPSEQSLQLFRSLPHHTDMGMAPFLGSDSGNEEGAVEYELWFRPCDRFPEGLVMRVLGDANPIVLHLEEDEAIPGPLPYVDAAGKPVFTFTHAGFEQRGGRVYASSPLDGVIQKQNQLNQLDSFILQIINRMSNPLWLVPKGAEIQKFTGQPGLVVQWNPLTVGGTAKPERVDGLGPNASLFQVRQQYLDDIEQGMGTFDVLKGSKPVGVDSFSGMQLLVERGQSRFASAFKARGSLYKNWFKFALELEREFGPDERTRSVLGPSRTWTLQQFKNAELQGTFDIVVEDGSMTPKTALGLRASVEHLNQLGMIDATDPDQKYKIFQLFGQSSLSPSLDIHMQAALRKQQAFEDWAQSPDAQAASMELAMGELNEYQATVAKASQAQPQMSPDGMQMAPAALPPPPSVTKHTPLAWKPWYSPAIHRQEFLKWANSDVIVQLLAEQPQLEEVLAGHLLDIDMAMAATMAPAEGAPSQGQDGKGVGAGRTMANSNSESGGVQNAENNQAPPK